MATQALSRIADVEARERTLEATARIGVSGLVAAVAVLGHSPGTLQHFYLLMAVSAGLYVLARGERLFLSALRYLTSPLLRWRWAFLLWAAASLFWSVRGGTGPERVVTLLQIYVLGLFFYDAVWSLGLGRWVLGNVLVWSVVGVLIAFGSGILAEGGRLQGLYGNPNVLGLAALVGLCAFAAGADGARTAWRRVFVHLAGLTLLAGVAASSSRKGFVGVILIWLASLLQGRSRGRALINAALVLALGAVLISAFEPLRIIWSLALDRMMEIVTSLTSVSGGAKSLVERTEFIRMGLMHFAQEPIAGFGIDSFWWLAGQGRYAHNNMIEIGVGMGIVGLVLYYGLNVALLFRAAFLPRAEDLLRRFVFVFVPTFLLLDVGFVSYYSKMQTLLLIVCAAWIDRSSMDAAHERDS